jgi:tetratricopeptide (TPR) repeat protein
MLAIAAVRLQAVEGAAMLKVPAAARSAALGGAFSMVAGNAESMWYNPAGIGGMNGGEFGFSHSAWIAGASNDFLFGALGGEHWGLGAYGQYSAMGDIARDAFGSPGGAFTDSGQVAGLALAGQSGFLRLGLGAKILGQTVAGRSGHGFAGDAGAIATLFGGHLAAALSALNIGTAPEPGGGNTAARLPVNLRAGIGLMKIAGFKILGEYRRWNESSQNSLAGGAELMLAFKGAELDCRGGYESGLAEGGLAGMSAGVGVGLEGLRVDYSFQALGELGNAQRLSLDWRYKNAPSKKIEAPAERQQFAKAEYEAGHFQKAAELFSELAESNPGSFGMQTAAGMSYRMAGNKPAALNYFRRARRLKPGRQDVLERIHEMEAP